MLDIKNTLWLLAPETSLGHPKNTDIFFVYSSITGVQFELNEVSHDALSLIPEGGITVEILASSLAAMYDAPPAIIAEDLYEIFRELHEYGLLKPAPSA